MSLAMLRSDGSVIAHGIIMSAPMVLALLTGRKTVTRRTSDRWAKVSPGDRLWVRETWRTVALGDKMSPSFLGEEWGAIYGSSPATPDVPIRYEADGAEAHTDRLEDGGGGWSKRARPAIHLPRWASRIVLEVVSIDREQGVEGVNAIRRGDVLPSVTDAEAIAEGIYSVSASPCDGLSSALTWTWGQSAPRFATPRLAYLALFREINGDAMPDHLWRIEFRRIGP